MEAIISPHWFKFTVPFEYADAELDKVCVELFGHSLSVFDKKVKSLDYYRNCTTFQELVSIYRDGWMRNKGSTCFDVSGTGLDTLGLDIAKLGKFALENGGNICRIDIAVQDTNDFLPYDEIVNLCSKANFKDRVRTRFNRGVGNLPKIEIQPLRRIQFGSELSDSYLIVYDRQHTEDVDFPWLCFEQRITNRQDCEEIIRTLLDGKDAGEFYAALLRGKLDFLQVGGKKERRKTEDWWTRFLGGVAACKVKRLPKKHNPWRIQRQGFADLRRALRDLSSIARRRDAEGLLTIMQEAQLHLEMAAMSA